MFQEPLEKVCQLCGGDPQPIENFSPHFRRKDGSPRRKPQCKNCLAAWAKRWRASHPEKRTLGIYSVAFDALWAAQKGLCALCEEPMTTGGKQYLSACVDHDHACCPGYKSCGKCVRGLIHRRCNMLLGNALDRFDLLEAAIRYLKRFDRGFLQL
jgi:hypothetical protein